MHGTGAMWDAFSKLVEQNPLYHHYVMKIEAGITPLEVCLVTYDSP